LAFVDVRNFETHFQEVPPLNALFLTKDPPQQ
jgi:hypothetical protein